MTTARKEPALLIFDLDGVLVDSEGLLVRHYSKELAGHGVDLSPDLLAQRFAGARGLRMNDLIFETSGFHLDDAILGAIRQSAQQALADDLIAIAGAQDLLSHLTGPRCICSNSSPSRIRKSLGTTGLTRFFEDAVLFSGVEVTQPKPHPEIHHKASAAFQVAPEDVIVIEDSLTGIEAALSAGCRVIGFYGGSHCPPDHDRTLMKAGAVKVTNRLSEIPQILAELL